MKYIRTKDGIYENKPLEHKFGVKGKGGYSIEYKNSDILNQADTIEELCDEFVVVGSLCCSLLNENEKQDIKRFAKSNLFGAIWTDKGLIYVAKMNENGDLELI